MKFHFKIPDLTATIAVSFPLRECQRVRAGRRDAVTRRRMRNMSWDSIDSRSCGIPAHQLSATRLLASPDPSRSHLDDGPAPDAIIDTISYTVCNFSNSTQTDGRKCQPTELVKNQQYLSLISLLIDEVPVIGDANARRHPPSFHRGIALTDRVTLQSVMAFVKWTFSLPEVYPYSEDWCGGGAGEGGGGGRWGARFGPAHAPTANVLDCFRACRSRLDQYLARRKIERGVRLYTQNEQRLAVKVWLSALRGVKHRTDKFSLLGHLYHAYMDFGKYRESLEFAHRQLGISEELDSAPMRAEAYLNLARAHQTLGGLDRALSYARHALYNDCGGGSTAGSVHLTVASVSLELGAFSKAMDGFQKALNVAQSAGDNTLLLQVYVGLSELWCRLRDAERAVACAARACDLGRGPRSADLNTRHHRRALLQMAQALRRRGELGDAHDYCNVSS
ncbi:43 kDa receptor-associated protein of the synapse homolog [Eumeta japonica]|uniref:43 kDa receptor-associated protein of the synapse homolog n=1 Tax=Eumeta variegata TaxID=151549 RepID=A0A4C1UFU0_EUMVA|nr:43 kDa receptor-associated protein of the synapse homolog [Eumeta japonica]